MAAHSSILAWKIPWAEEPGRLQSMGSLRVRPDWATSFSLFTFHFHALEEEMATYSSVLAWRIPGTGEPGGLPSMGSHRVRHDWSDLLTAAATWIQLEIIVQRNRKTSPIWYHLYMESKIWHKSTYLWKRNRLTDRTQTRSCQKGGSWVREDLGAWD